MYEFEDKELQNYINFMIAIYNAEEIREEKCITI